MSKSLGFLSACAVVAAAFAGCSREGATEGRLQVVATTGMIGDMAARIAGEHALVESLMGPGVDPHLYKPRESDVRRLARADLTSFRHLLCGRTRGVPGSDCSTAGNS